MTSKGRLKPFRRAFDGHEQPAMELYVLDAHLASLMHGQLRQVELLLRGQIGRVLTERYGPNWCQAEFDGYNPAGLGNTCLNMLQNARAALQREHRAETPTNILSHLPMSFWVKLLEQPGDADHHTTIWEAGVAHLFNSGDTVTWNRKVAMRVCQRLIWARNRVNHSEPVVFGFPQKGIRHEGKQVRVSARTIIEDCRVVTGRFDEHLGEWMRSLTELDELLDDPLTVQAWASVRERRGIHVEED